MFEVFSDGNAWVALLTLTFLELVLGVDNIVFISLTANKVEPSNQKAATNWGLILAMVQRILLLCGISLLVAMKEPFFSIKASWISAQVSVQGVILLAGGLFLLYKSVTEIHEKLEFEPQHHQKKKPKEHYSLGRALVQIVIMDLIFSLDSVLTAVGMTNGIGESEGDALLLMIIAVVISILGMLLFANAIRNFISEHPSVQLLALSFLILIGFMLLTEAAHLSQMVVFDQEIGEIPKGYLYFAIAFSMLVEFLNMRFRKKQNSSNPESHNPH